MCWVFSPPTDSFLSAALLTLPQRFRIKVKEFRARPPPVAPNGACFSCHYPSPLLFLLSPHFPLFVINTSPLLQTLPVQLRSRVATATHGVQDERAGLLQVPVAALQQLLALASGPQTQTEQLLHLKAAAGPASEWGFQKSPLLLEDRSNALSSRVRFRALKRSDSSR